MTCWKWYLFSSVIVYVEGIVWHLYNRIAMLLLWGYTQITTLCLPYGWVANKIFSAIVKQRHLFHLCLYSVYQVFEGGVSSYIYIMTFDTTWSRKTKHTKDKAVMCGVLFAHLRILALSPSRIRPSWCNNNRTFKNMSWTLETISESKNIGIHHRFTALFGRNSKTWILDHRAAKMLYWD